MVTGAFTLNLIHGHPFVDLSGPEFSESLPHVLEQRVPGPAEERCVWPWG